MTNFQLSPNGEKIALTLIKRSKTDWRVDIRQLWVVDRDGRNFILLDSVVNTNSNEFTSMGGFLWSPDNSYIAYMTTFKTSFTQTLVTTSLTQSVEAIYFAMP
jgi:protease II